MIQRYYDPQTRDYVRQNGGFKKHRGEMPTVLWLLQTPKGSCAVAPEAGNRFAEVDILAEESERRFRQFTEEALKPLTSTGRIRKLAIDVEVRGSAMYGVVEFEDATGPQKQRFRA